MVSGETPPHRTVQSKRFVTKVMFMAAVTRPTYDTDGEVIFDGKLGMWPFVEHGIAKRSSVNRPAVAPETRSVTMGRDEHRDMLVKNVIPAIRSKCPPFLRNLPLVIQQDGSRCHVQPDDPAIRVECSREGWNIRLEAQPPNSPDLNILDLGFFASIQALQYEESPSNTDELIANCYSAFAKLRDTTLDDTFVSLQTVMECVIQEFGGNTYKWPHIGKAKLRRTGLLGRNYVCDESVYLIGAAYHFLATQERLDREALLRLQAEAFHILTSEE